MTIFFSIAILILSIGVAILSYLYVQVLGMIQYHTSKSDNWIGIFNKKHDETPFFVQKCIDIYMEKKYPDVSKQDFESIVNRICEKHYCEKYEILHRECTNYIENYSNETIKRVTNNRLNNFKSHLFDSNIIVNDIHRFLNTKYPDNDIVEKKLTVYDGEKFEWSHQ